MMKFVLAIEVKEYQETGEKKYMFVERGWAETDPKYRQIIPYVVLYDNKGRVGLFQRNKGSEKRLSGLYTIGVGGHIDFKDVSDLLSGDNFIDNALSAAVFREVEEEVNICPTAVINTGKIIESSDTDVDSVHYGIIFKAKTNLSEEQIRKNMGSLARQELIFHGFKTIEEIWKITNLESWSQKTLPQL